MCALFICTISALPDSNTAGASCFCTVTKIDQNFELNQLDHIHAAARKLAYFLRNC